ncbi:MAG: T9SS type A sorting domain-containing protein [Bacteroidota bacterium]
MRYIVSISVCILLLQWFCLSAGIDGFCRMDFTQQMSKTNFTYDPNPNLVLVYVDFSDGRLPSGQPPSTIVEINDPANNVSANSVGSLGWEKDSLGNMFMEIRKYVYEDYWDQFFSDNTWVGQRNPDWLSHQGNAGSDEYGRPITMDMTLYGSVKEYWKEVSYGNHIITPYPTHNGGSDKYHTGIVNNIDNIGGKHYIHWINLPNSRSTYENNNPYGDVIAKLRALHTVGNPEYIDFDIDSFKNNHIGKIVIIGAGGFDYTYAHFGGYADDVPGTYIVFSEKESRATYSTSILSPLFGYCHEYGHLMGFTHIQGGSYEIMHWGSLQPIYHICPPHTNPIHKLWAGWIPQASIVRINANTTNISLAPLDAVPVSGVNTVALITVYGDAGRNNNYQHSEYFVVENRQREGFNRFAGGINPPQGFTGGALIWHYSSFSALNWDSASYYFGTGRLGNEALKNLILTVKNYPRIRYTPGDPNDFYPQHGTDLNQNSDPNTNSIDSLMTGISLNAFSVNPNDHKVSFNVNYQINAPPLYNYFFSSANEVPDGILSGNVFVNGSLTFDLPKNINISPGSTWDIIKDASISLSSGKFVSAGGNGINDSIKFEGIGYGNYREHWSGIAASYHNQNDSLIIRNSIIQNATHGLYLIENDVNGHWNHIIQGNHFKDNESDIIVQGTDLPNDIMPDISGLDNNIFLQFQLVGNCVLSSANQFIVPGGTLFMMYGGTYSSGLFIDNGNTFNVNGDLQIGDDPFAWGWVSIKGGNIILNNGLTVQQYTNLTIESGSVVKIGHNASILVDGTLNATGTSSQHITFTSANSSPAPGDWYNILLRDKSGPHTFSYCDIQYGTKGLWLMNPDGQSIIEYCTIKNCSQQGIDISNNDVNNSAANIRYSLISKNRQEGLSLISARADIYQSKIDSNGTGNAGPGISMCNSILFMGNSRIQYNYGNGIDISGINSIAYLSPDGFAAGNNTLFQNAGEINVHESGQILIGHYIPAGGYWQCDGEMDQLSLFNMNPCVWVPIPEIKNGGYNNIYNTGYSFSGYFVNDATNLGIYANNTYWGNTILPCAPPSGALSGPVNVSYPLCSSVYTPGQTAYTHINPGSESPTINGGRSDNDTVKYLKYLKYLVKHSPDSASIALHELSELAGPGKRYESLISVPWEDFLNHLEGAARPGKYKSLISSFRIQEKMNKKDYLNAASLADDIASNTSNNDLWTYCKTQKIIALYSQGNLSEAVQALSDLTPDIGRFNPRVIQHLSDMLSVAGANTNPGGSLVKPMTTTKASVPKDYALQQNYPNPFNPATIIQYQLPKESRVNLSIFNLLGQKVATLVNEFQNEGYKSVSFNATNLPSGVYFYRLQANNFSDVKKFIVMK